MNTNSLFVVGTVLCTKNSQKCSNGVIASVTQDSVTVLTDFGSLIELAKESLFANYAVSDSWLHHRNMGYPQCSIPNRIHRQIDQLQRSLKKLEG